MSNWGKILGAIFGFMFLKWPGLILGLLLGHYFDKGYAKAFKEKGGFSGLFSPSSKLKNRAIFFHSLFSVMGHIAKASGRVTEKDIALASALMDRMQLKDEVRQEAQQAYRAGKNTDFAFSDTVKTFKAYCFGRREFMQLYMEIQIQAAVANQTLHPKAKELLYAAGKILSFDKTQLDQLIQQAMAANQYHNSAKYNRAMTISQAYQVLGLVEQSSLKEVKRAYKRLMSQHHPDKLSAQGVPQQAVLMAKEKTQDIQAAYECIVQHNKARKSSL
ncbi:co-chaperone DjlA [Gayadomonas joobiniege]|uniref:co-chaperone DjlA n=1 Tax=Gayadomonas joobiniege TaxID=1234606 RepID=UPI000371BB0E|nr:co-chaperone DjlA [Gayadomonas joobiniege]